MALLPIVEYPDPILKRVAESVTDFGPDLQRLIDDMTETLYAAPGLGLATPQVGRALALFVFDMGVAEPEKAHQLTVVVNPTIVSMEGEQNDEEGCLSVPGYRERTGRANHVTLKGLDRRGGEIVLEGEGLKARLFQHEVDHLGGILFIDRLSPLKRDIFFRKWRKRRQD